MVCSDTLRHSGTHASVYYAFFSFYALGFLFSVIGVTTVTVTARSPGALAKGMP
jgi:hypothetical protein